jgi:hypothetical protein
VDVSAGLGKLSLFIAAIPIDLDQWRPRHNVRRMQIALKNSLLHCERITIETDA